MDHEGRGLKSQMKRADKLGARFVALLGEDELAARRLDRARHGGLGARRRWPDDRLRELPARRRLDG